MAQPPDSITVPAVVLYDIQQRALSAYIAVTHILMRHEEERLQAPAVPANVIVLADRRHSRGGAA